MVFLAADRTLKVNTVKRRTHSLFRQGVMGYRMLPGLREERLEQLPSAFDETVREHPYRDSHMG